MPKPMIVFRLANALHGLLQTELFQARYQENRLAVGLLLTLSREPFRSELLFRDYSLKEEELWLIPAREAPKAGGENDRGADSEDNEDPGAAEKPGQSPQSARIFRPALVYLSLVLSRRLALANNRLDQPTNMHVLFGSLAAHGAAEAGWSEVKVTRAKRPIVSLASSSSERIGRVWSVLKKQIARLGTGYGPVSARRRAKYGPFWLILSDVAAEMAEELSLWDCLAPLPVPLACDLNEASRDQLCRVLESLNERYALLRSCGLDPEQWYDDAELSVSGLRDLQTLRKAVNARLAAPPDGSQATTPERAYADAFECIRTDTHRPAGFATFEDFAESAVGQEMIHGCLVLLSTPLHMEGDDDLLLVSNLPAPVPESSATWPEHQVDRETALRFVIGQCPGIRDNPVLAWFVDATLINGRSIHGGDGVLADAEFRRLLDDSRRYPTTDDDRLLTQLERDLSEAIRYCTRLNRQP